MKYVTPVVIIFTLSIIEKSLLGLPLVFAYVVSLSFSLESEESFRTAFISGLILSLIKGSMLGLESLGLLMASGLIHLYEKRFSRKHILFSGVFAGLGSVVYSLIVDRTLTLKRLTVDVILVLMVLFFVSRFKNRYSSEGIFLKV